MTVLLERMFDTRARTSTPPGKGQGIFDIYHFTEWQERVTAILMWLVRFPESF